MRTTCILPVLICLIQTSCTTNEKPYDASGSFEADEVVVSAELNGKLISFTVEEGDTISKETVVGSIDAGYLSLQKEQVEATIAALRQKTTDVSPQVKLLQDQLYVQRSQLASLEHEKARMENLLKQDAATGKQLDDINAQVELMRRQMLVTQQQVRVQQTNVSTQNRSILSEGKPLQSRVAQLDDQLQKANIVNPVSGTVITRYAAAGEFTSAGKALYKIADLSVITMRAYITGVQLSQVKLKQQVKVLVDDGPDKYREYPGTISWISDKAEFTPKTIRTKEERANLVYAIKVKIRNDGYLKIGMYGELQLNSQ